MCAKWGFALSFLFTQTWIEPLMRYGVMLQAFSYQRFFVWTFNILTKKHYYTIATYMCGMLAVWPAFGMFNSFATYVIMLAIYARCVYKGDHIQSESRDREVLLFRQKSVYGDK